MSLEPDREQIKQFTHALFRNASDSGYVSLRSFYEEDRAKSFRITSIRLNGKGLEFLINAAMDDARRAAQAPKPVAFCPPVAVFADDKKARKKDVALGPALSVECDQSPYAAAGKLESILGPATVIIRSGGQWTDLQTGEVQNKLHLHWRLAKPAQGGSLPNLEEARRLACSIVDGDPSNVPISHPIRWAGSWHCKAEPRLCEIEYLYPDREIELDWALIKLAAAAPAAADQKTNGEARATGEAPGDVAAIMARLGAGVRKLIMAPPIEDEDRSRTLASAITSMIRFGLSDAEIRTVIEAHPRGIGAKYIGRPDLATEIARLREKAKKWDTGNTSSAGSAAPAWPQPIDLWAKFAPPKLPRDLLCSATIWMRASRQSRWECALPHQKCSWMVNCCLI